MATQPKQVFLFDMTRHRSHLVFRYLSTHPDVQSIWHPFLPAFLFGPERITLRTKGPKYRQDGAADEFANRGTSTYAEVTETWLSGLQEATEQGKIPVSNEHCQMVLKQEIVLATIRNEAVPALLNPTVIPDHIFKDLVPVFIIRNPVFAVPSNYVALRQTTQVQPGDEEWKVSTTMQHQRYLFDFFYQRDGRTPIVVDGDDVIWRTEELGNGLCQGLNLKPGALSETWNAVPEDQRAKDPLLRFFLQTIDDSTGIEKLSPAPPDPDVGRAHSQWIEKYGQEDADQLKLTVESNMPHYEYLKQFKI